MTEAEIVARTIAWVGLVQCFVGVCGVWCSAIAVAGKGAVAFWVLIVVGVLLICSSGLILLGATL